jgi:hypothetical protein
MCLTGCFDITETFNIKEDGSGVYEMKMDMSRAFGMIAMMKGAGGQQEGKAPQKLDSTIYYSNMVDTVSTLSAEEKAAFKEAYAKLHMDEEEGDIYVNMFFPFKDGKQLAVIQKSLSKKGKNPVMDALGKAMKSGAGASSGMDQIIPAPPSQDGIDAIPAPPSQDAIDAMAGGMSGSKTGNKSGLPTSDFVYNLDGKSFSRKVDVSAAKPTKAKSKDDEMPAQFKEMMKVNYTTIVNLPRPAKKLSGKGTLSADKKQVKFTKGMSLDDPQLPADFDFTIDY